jgi:hypothetical protein
MPDILMPPGKYRIAFHPTITKGHSYLGFACKKCQEPILMFSDPSKGSAVRFNMVQLVDPGTLVIECYHCGHDDEYAGTDLSQFKATEDRPSFRDRRPTASGSPRQKFQFRYPGAKVIFGVGALEHRQDCAVVISRSVIYWIYVESALADLLSFMLKAQTEPAIAMFLSLRNARAKTDALEATAELTLAPNPAAYEMFQAVMRYKDAVEKERNNLVHGILGISKAVQNGVIWISTFDYIEDEEPGGSGGQARGRRGLGPGGGGFGRRIKPT